MSDGNDSNVKRQEVIEASSLYNDVFFNTAIPKDLEKFPGPVVLTLNPGEMTDTDFHKVDPVPLNIMFFRIRTNTWNLPLVEEAIRYYGPVGVPIVLTFMAYHGESDIPDSHRFMYDYRQRTLNSYYAISSMAWNQVMEEFINVPLVYSCGREGVSKMNSCRNCGNCIREYYAAKERMKGEVE